MLPKANRLKKKKDFDRASKQGRTAAGSFLVLKTSVSGLSVSRFGFVVSKKVSNKAVIRNKAKRRLREAVKDVLAKIKPGYDCIFFTKKGIVEKDLTEVKEEVGALLERAGLVG